MNNKTFLGKKINWYVGMTKAKNPKILVFPFVYNKDETKILLLEGLDTVNIENSYPSKEINRIFNLNLYNVFNELKFVKEDKAYMLSEIKILKQKLEKKCQKLLDRKYKAFLEEENKKETTLNSKEF